MVERENRILQAVLWLPRVAKVHLPPPTHTCKIKNWFFKKQKPELTGPAGVGEVCRGPVSNKDLGYSVHAWHNQLPGSILEALPPSS